jgi:hypothetical protein
MDLNKCLILIKGQDKTKEIQHIDKINGRIAITYTNGGTYSYMPSNVKILNIKRDIDARDSYVLRKGQPLSNVAQIQDFSSYKRIIFTNGYNEICNPNEIEIIKSCLSDKKSRDRFEYLRQIAHAVSLNIDDGVNILDRQYQKIQLVREECVLASYLSGILSASQENKRKTLFYPFSFNESQKRAVENALNNRISIIQGPPGTGKTQTILNIIANAVMKDETVVVVSSNNSATYNVLEKLREHEVDFITAYLGNSRNKEEFIKN